MRLYNLAVAIVLSLSIVLPAYAGDDAERGSKRHKQKFETQISFGDSLSDVGTYAVGTIAALGGGEFTVNSAGVQNWSALMAAKFG